ncbi:MAG: HAD-IA family hydrolase [Woeseiaceae bacterium]|nr:HAD-IA family hydrolase [Woeseiaceae bacterium]
MAERIVLFDLGGVLADLGRPADAMQLGMSNDEFWAIWLNSPDVRAFERGRIAIDEFCDRLAPEFGESSGARMRERLERWQLRLFDGVERLVSDVASEARVALLSNTNALHWSQVTRGNDVFDRFDALFLSFETGHFKPDPAAFEQVVAHYGCAPRNIVFLDDAQRNVDAARASGFEAHVVRGPAEARSKLDDE